MLRALLLALLLAVALPATAATPGHHVFNDDAALDTTQVIDTRATWGELICRSGDVVPWGCEIDTHPAT